MTAIASCRALTASAVVRAARTRRAALATRFGISRNCRRQPRRDDGERFGVSIERVGDALLTDALAFLDIRLRCARERHARRRRRRRTGMGSRERDRRRRRPRRCWRPAGSPRDRPTGLGPGLGPEPGAALRDWGGVAEGAGLPAAVAACAPVAKAARNSAAASVRAANGSEIERMCCLHPQEISAISPNSPPGRSNFSHPSRLRSTQRTMTLFDVVIVTPNLAFGLFLPGAPISTPKSPARRPCGRQFPC